MFSPEIAYLVNKECHKDRLREIEHQRLIKIAESQQSGNEGWFGKVANWVGTRLIEWGPKMQHHSDPVYHQVKR